MWFIVSVIYKIKTGSWRSGMAQTDAVLISTVTAFHFMMTSSNGKIFRVTGLFLRGIHRSPVNYPHKGQWRGALMFTLICARINGWVNNPEAGDLRRHCTHYDVIVMCLTKDMSFGLGIVCDTAVIKIGRKWDFVLSKGIPISHPHYGFILMTVIPHFYFNDYHLQTRIPHQCWYHKIITNEHIYKQCIWSCWVSSVTKRIGPDFCIFDKHEMFER